MNKILIIEDDRDASEIMRIYAEGEFGMQTEQIYDGADALDRLADTTKEKPALVILDLHLPKHSGQEILDAIKRETNIPVAIVSAFPEDADKLLEKADAVFVKPIDKFEFIIKLNSLLRPPLDAREGSGE